MKKVLLVVPLILVLLLLGLFAWKTYETHEFSAFIKAYEAQVVPIWKEASIAYFEATISGKEEDYKKSEELQIKLTKIWSNKQEFAKLKKWKESRLITNPLLKRQLQVIFNSYLANQVDEKKLEEMVRRQTEIEKKFNTYRAQVGGKTMSDNEIDEILRNSTDSKALESVWTASKSIGKVVEKEVLELVKLRNEVAKELGFTNYHAMQLSLSDQDPQEIERLFDELDRLTREIFAQAKSEIDAFFAKRYNIEKNQLRPWHYQNRFFQEAPKIYEVDLDAYFKDKDVVEITRAYYEGLGLSMDDIFKKSDLYEKPGKYQHAYCTDIDRSGDVRVVCSVKPDHNWMATLLHEYGHAAYAKYNDLSLPWVLRDAAHIFTTEAIAMMMERFASNPLWLKEVIGISEEESRKIAQPSSHSLRLGMLVFSRWSQVMYRFEKSLYENPEQDLNKLWWDLVEKYQSLEKPEGRNEPDWASKIHIATVPAYYHNYLMGDLLASQLLHHINTKILKLPENEVSSWKGRKEAGAYLIEQVFKPGMRYSWNEMIEKATGEKLTSAYYAKNLAK